jgi:hypothetical protein
MLRALAVFVLTVITAVASIALGVTLLGDPPPAAGSVRVARAYAAARADARPSWPPVTWSAELRAAWEEDRLGEAVRLFERLPNPSAQDQYLAGWSLMTLHRPIEAEPRLAAARDQGFVDWPGWPELDALLGRAQVCRRLAPPLIEATGQGGSSIAIHAETLTPWAESIVQAKSRFEEVGRRVFGKDLAPVRLYLFTTRAPFESFHRALIGEPVPYRTAVGTGVVNAALCCECDADGRRTPDSAGTFVAMHELAHAWCDAYLVERRTWRAEDPNSSWLEEGIAEFFTCLLDPAQLDGRSAWLREQVEAGAPAPAFGDFLLYRRFHEVGDLNVHYAMAMILVAELLGSRGEAPGNLRRVLDEIRASNDVGTAVRTVTGKDPAATFEAIVRRFWPR